ncbi:hypothetical protein CC1G_11222 [Coprinopsis cinerea okayama7|uniref:Dolichyl-diphosphooligosaccharide-protein glycosyltransferase subunit OST5 n=1 Tax=Coprinopsis cinerea (strain Okayama-7 / 130 / ATCC MYA-4618 / FGSC 9003) TaxID=240176 RepID=A8N121_COPC7|nr:hypothetical protein CC1G_11222 [Coprinopsis cinerea okayama7\|eukprot:XP_001828570.1 hypothetical protein CC1G_11222 [Coprinopsis cinerea okayama7\
MDYAQFKALHNAHPPFSPLIPVSLLPWLALILLAATFSLTFYFSTLPKSTVPVKELGVASAASILAGFGVVALFCTAGVYV